jgi:hypothetical protein
MRKNFRLLLIASSLLIISQFISCRKIDFHFKDPAKLCRILNITENFDGNGLTHRTFSYDSWGNPTKVEYAPEEQGTGNPTFIFAYDSKHRLIAYDGFSTHHYTYNSKGQAVIDSVVSNYAGQDARYEEKLSYDLFGRLVKVVSKFYYSGQPDDPNVGTTTTDEYKYDFRGNLIRPGITYDNKTSIFRTHPVWMLVHRDYSANNIEGALTYNDAGLPLTYGSSFATFLEKPMALDVVVYDCGKK